jgi:hypothetical protein
MALTREDWIVGFLGLWVLLIGPARFLVWTTGGPVLADDSLGPAVEPAGSRFRPGPGGEGMGVGCVCRSRPCPEHAEDIETCACSS